MLEFFKNNEFLSLIAGNRIEIYKDFNLIIPF